MHLNLISHRGQTVGPDHGSPPSRRWRHLDAVRQNLRWKIFGTGDLQFRQNEVPLRRKLEVRIDADAATRDLDRVSRRNHRRGKASGGGRKPVAGGRHSNEHPDVGLHSFQAVSLPGKDQKADYETSRN